MNWRLIWRGLQKPSMRNKILAVFGILLVYRILAHVPLPLSDPTTLKQLIDNLLNSEGAPQLLSFINVLSGGALASLSIMLVGLGPYINALDCHAGADQGYPQAGNDAKRGGVWPA